MHENTRRKDEGRPHQEGQPGTAESRQSVMWSRTVASVIQASRLASSFHEPKNAASQFSHRLSPLCLLSGNSTGIKVGWPEGYCRAKAAAVNVDPRHDVYAVSSTMLRAIPYSTVETVVRFLEPISSVGPPIHRGRWPGGSLEPRLPAQSVALAMPEAAAATTHARKTQGQSEKCYLLSRRTDDLPSITGANTTSRRSSKTHDAVTSDWYTPPTRGHIAVTRSATYSCDEAHTVQLIPNSDTALLALRNNDWTGSQFQNPPAPLPDDSPKWKREAWASCQPTAAENVTTLVPLQFLFLFFGSPSIIVIISGQVPSSSPSTEVLKYRSPRGVGDGGGGGRGRTETQSDEQTPAAAQTEKQTKRT
ncbi:hypothetical protein H4582DRAFT_2059270 [Lactarius indigo]|nr:hypothetical protein H4582DRAFT_2059270 [Lactarius indigo]